MRLEESEEQTTSRKRILTERMIVSESLQVVLYAVAYLICGFGMGVGVCLFLAYIKGDALIHRIRYKEWVLPCPSCRDEETDKPTGKMPPQSGELKAALKKAGVKDTMPEFDCSTCKGTKKVVYEFPRLERPEINERQILEGPSPDLPRPKRGLLG